jgi:L(+)-tartrate dehydratase beta subunit
MATEDEPVANHLTGPLDDATARALRVGEVVSVDGVIWGLRDATLIRIFDEGVIPPVDLTGAILLHTAPSARRRADGHYEPVSVGTTTSMRMDRFTRGCVETLGARAIVGKGGLSHSSGEALVAAGAVYLSIVGGAASPETLQIQSIEEVYFEDLQPECLWKFRVRDFGPLFVTMDSQGQSAYEAVTQRAMERRARAEQILGL